LQTLDGEIQLQSDFLFNDYTSVVKAGVNATELGWPASRNAGRSHLDWESI
jgi:hypothetical protein